MVVMVYLCHFQFEGNQCPPSCFFIWGGGGFIKFPISSNESEIGTGMVEKVVYAGIGSVNQCLIEYTEPDICRLSSLFILSVMPVYVQ